MRAAKILTLVLVLISIAICGLWYYATFTVSNKINEQYSSKPIAFKSFDKQDYFISFDKVKPNGFPFQIAWIVQGWSEESMDAEIKYSAPIKFGYNILLQQAFVEYSGDIIASYKPESRGFGSRLKIKDYKITVDLPLTAKLIADLKNMKDPIGIINYIRDINISTGKVEIFDLVDEEKFYDKEYEHLKLSFIKSKEYTDLEDFLDNIPQHYEADYGVKVNSVETMPRKIPVSLFYGFTILPNEFKAKAKIIVDTKGNNINEVTKGIKVQADIYSYLPVVNLSNLKIHYEGGHSKSTQEADIINISSRVRLNKGFFDKLFSYYKLIADELRASKIGQLVDREAQYIMNNKNYFRFEDIEDTDYEFNLKMNSYSSKEKLYMKIHDLSVFSDSAGIKIVHEMEAQNKGYKRLANQRWFAKGVLLLKNYPAIVDFTSGYIYRFGKFRFLSDDARNIYIDVNKSVLKQISDHPKSNSEDLSFEYLVDSENLKETKFGTAKIDQISQIYKLTLYEKLFSKVGFDDNALEQVTKIFPDLDVKDPMLKKFLPKLSKAKDLGIDKEVKKNIEKAVPKEAKKILDQVVPKDVFKKGVFKGLVK